jgi:8-oxo-dGTP diphosphatase
MDLGVVALVFLFRLAGGTLTQNSEVMGFRWVRESEVSAIMPEAFAVRILDAYRHGAVPPVRAHEGVRLIASMRYLAR